ncbi:CCA tRNA nucleotidyltransferase, partial [candidate division WOR-3 bacterium]|nr:CCA tRNA nucleotidyltransferase [candidate division WOR-3 bacterium]
IDVNIAENGLKKDIMRRDFTINAISCDKEGNVIDIINGINDLEKHIIRTVSKNSFTDDPLRMLRAYRLKKELGFDFAKGLRSNIKNNAHLIKDVSKERINVELMMMFKSNESSYLFKELDEVNLLLNIFPYLLKTKDYYHKKYKTRTLYNHLLKTVYSIDKVIKHISDSDLKEYAKNHIYELYLAALFHDITKPIMEVRKKNKLSFAGHDLQSAMVTSDILKNDLKMSNQMIKRISKLIRMHMRPHMILSTNNVTQRGFFRLFRDADDDIAGLIILTMADKFSSEGIIDKNYIKLFRKMKMISNKLREKKIRFITGNDIMKAFKIKPSPLIGQLIDEGNEFALKNQIKDKSVILEYLKKKMNRNDCSHKIRRDGG